MLRIPTSLRYSRAAAETGQTVDQYNAVASVAARRRHIIRAVGGPAGSVVAPRRRLTHSDIELSQPATKRESVTSL